MDMTGEDEELQEQEEIKKNLDVRDLLYFPIEGIIDSICNSCANKANLDIKEKYFPDFSAEEPFDFRDEGEAKSVSNKIARAWYLAFVKFFSDSYKPAIKKRLDVKLKIPKMTIKGAGKYEYANAVIEAKWRRQRKDKQLKFYSKEEYKKIINEVKSYAKNLVYKSRIGKEITPGQFERRKDGKRYYLDMLMLTDRFKYDVSRRFKPIYDLVNNSFRKKTVRFWRKKKKLKEGGIKNEHSGDEKLSR